MWLEKPERIAALARLTVLGLLVYSVIQRQVRLYLRMHDQQLPGNKGLTATPTAAVVLALFTQVALVQLWIDEQEVVQFSGVQPHHLLVCDALGLDASWYAVPSASKTAGTFRPLERGVKRKRSRGSTSPHVRTVVPGHSYDSRCHPSRYPLRAKASPRAPAL
jgi:hypothetical protein